MTCPKNHPDVLELSMGMSLDYEVAVRRRRYDGPHRNGVVRSPNAR